MQKFVDLSFSHIVSGVHRENFKASRCDAHTWYKVPDFFRGVILEYRKYVARIVSRIRTCFFDTSSPIPCHFFTPSKNFPQGYYPCVRATFVPFLPTCPLLNFLFVFLGKIYSLSKISKNSAHARVRKSKKVEKKNVCKRK